MRDQHAIYLFVYKTNRKPMALACTCGDSVGHSHNEHAKTDKETYIIQLFAATKAPF